MSNSYKETFWDCFNHAGLVLDKSGYTSPQFENYLHTGSIAYGTSWQHSFELITAKGNVARKGLQMSVQRNDHGRYECYVYIL